MTKYIYFDQILGDTEPELGKTIEVRGYPFKKHHIVKVNANVMEFWDCYRFNENTNQKPDPNNIQKFLELVGRPGIECGQKYELIGTIFEHTEYSICPEKQQIGAFYDHNQGFNRDDSPGRGRGSHRNRSRNPPRILPNGSSSGSDRSWTNVETGRTTKDFPEEEVKHATALNPEMAQAAVPSATDESSSSISMEEEKSKIPHDIVSMEQQQPQLPQQPQQQLLSSSHFSNEENAVVQTQLFQSEIETFKKEQADHAHSIDFENINSQMELQTDLTERHQLMKKFMQTLVNAFFINMSQQRINTWNMDRSLAKQSFHVSGYPNIPVTPNKIAKWLKQYHNITCVYKLVLHLINKEYQQESKRPHRYKPY